MNFGNDSGKFKKRKKENFKSNKNLRVTFDIPDMYTKIFLTRNQLRIHLPFLRKKLTM